MGGVFVGDKWVATEFLSYDPVYDCKVFKEDGCVHVDGPLCDMDKCNLLKHFPYIKRFEFGFCFNCNRFNPGSC